MYILGKAKDKKVIIGTHYGSGQIELHSIVITNVMKLNKLEQQVLLIKLLCH